MTGRQLLVHQLHAVGNGAFGGPLQAEIQSRINGVGLFTSDIRFLPTFFAAASTKYWDSESSVVPTCNPSGAASRFGVLLCVPMLCYRAFALARDCGDPARDRDT
jgi:hypothetical protein